MAADLTPAYPRTGSENLIHTEYNTLPQEGMLIADVFAIEAFKVIYPPAKAEATDQDPVDLAALATESYAIAAAMIEARNAYIAS